jgi:hypothetical protein
VRLHDTVTLFLDRVKNSNSTIVWDGTIPVKVTLEDAVEVVDEEDQVDLFSGI